MSVIITPFQAYLIREGVVHLLNAQSGVIEVPSSLDIFGEEPFDLPKGLIVHGSLTIEDTAITHLPDGLRVVGNLCIRKSQITTLPQTLRVGGSIEISKSHLTSLPDGLTVRGDLTLFENPIEVLPDGLVVEHNLRLGRTHIRRLPSDLRVGGRIYPPLGLLDLRGFMATQTGPVLLRFPNTRHEQLALRAQLRPFPDMWPIVAGLGTTHSLRGHPDGRGSYTMHLEAAHHS